MQKQPIGTKGEIILGMIMLADENRWDANTLFADLNSQYDINVNDMEEADSADVFTVNDEPVALMHIPAPIPDGDIEGTAKYAYNWPDAIKDISQHKAHIIVKVMGGGNDQIKRYKIFTQVVCSLLRTTDALGVYIGGQSLLIPKEDYLNQAALMREDYYPLNLWIYFGLRKLWGRKSGYTYGLSAFGKAEIEVINSSKSLDEIRGFLFNISYYVLENNVIFEHGQTCGLSADEKIVITYSKGKFVDGDSFKLAY